MKGGSHDRRDRVHPAGSVDRHSSLRDAGAVGEEAVEVLNPRLESIAENEQMRQEVLDELRGLCDSEFKAILQVATELANQARDRENAAIMAGDPGPLIVIAWVFDLGLIMLSDEYDRRLRLQNGVGDADTTTA